MSTLLSSKLRGCSSIYVKKNFEKPFAGGHDPFGGKRESGDKNQYNLFCRK